MAGYLHELPVKGLLARSVSDISAQALYKSSLGKISVRDLFARPQYKISTRGLVARSLYKFPKRVLLARSRSEPSVQALYRSSLINISARDLLARFAEKVARAISKFARRATRRAIRHVQSDEMFARGLPRHPVCASLRSRNAYGHLTRDPFALSGSSKLRGANIGEHRRTP